MYYIAVKFHDSCEYFQKSLNFRSGPNLTLCANTKHDKKQTVTYTGSSNPCTKQKYQITYSPIICQNFNKHEVQAPGFELKV